MVEEDVLQSNEEISVASPLPCLSGDSLPAAGGRAKLPGGSRFVCDPWRCHCPHGESLVMPEFLFLVLLLPSG